MRTFGYSGRILSGGRTMAAYDLVVRGGTVATATDIGEADVGVADGRIVALGLGLDPGREEIDARGRLVLPGGVDSHCHIEQPGSTGGTNADTFLSGSVSAACGEPPPRSRSRRRCGAAG